MNRLRSALRPPLFDDLADPLPHAAGATWGLPEPEPGARLGAVRGVLRDGPAGPGGD
ncbi:MULTISPECIES: hypothetical protein [unclassified Nocardiopsis]|uniref:hypothetical protein n=1 Tax=unclassified Nocardiopsis TaxID=2649073 RepID=UPI0018FE5125|nr:hypothetical protein [Nocardiopsis sp. TSRI0078]